MDYKALVAQGKYVGGRMDSGLERDVVFSLCDAVEVLEKDLRWCIDEMTETTDKFGLPDVPRHECEYLTRPDKGTCAFHGRFVDIMDRLGYFTEALALSRPAPTASTPTPAAPSDA